MGELVEPEQFGPFDALADLAFVEYQIGDRDRAVRLCRTFLPVTMAAGDEPTTRYLLYALVRAYIELGEVGPALDVIDELTARCRQDAQPYWRAKVSVVRAFAMRRRGALDQVVENVAVGWVLTGTPDGSVYSQVSAAVVLAEGLRSLEMYEEADRILADMIAVTRSRTTLVGIVVDAVRTLAEWAMRLLTLGLEDQAQGVAAELASRALLLDRLDQERAYGPLAQVASGFAWVVLGESAYGLDQVERARTGLRTDRAEWLMRYAAAALAQAALGAVDAAARDADTLTSAAAAADRSVWVQGGEWVRLGLALTEPTPPASTVLAARMARDSMRDLWAERAARVQSVRALVRVHELELENERQVGLVRTDPLTGVGNRRALEDLLRSTAGAVAALFADIDRFKEVNDRFSHVLGDDVLIAVARLLRAQAPADSLVARFGGDEFVVLMPGVTDLAQVEELADRVAAALDTADWAALADDLRPTLSFGIATAEPALLLEQLSIAVLAAKAEGRNRRVTLEHRSGPDDRRQGPRERRLGARERRAPGGDDDVSVPHGTIGP